MPRTVNLHRRAAGPNTAQSGAAPGGTMGGRPKRSAGRRPGSRPVNVGDEMYLWLLVIIEVLLMGMLRRNFRRHHGG